METVVLTILQLIQTLLPQIGVSSSVVNQILTALIQIVPIVVNLGPTVINSVNNIIAALQSSADLTDDQLSTLAELSAELDTAYEASVAAYLVSKKVTPAATAAIATSTADPEPAAQAPVSSAQVTASPVSAATSVPAVAASTISGA
jgi:hypothetical protein